MNPFLIITLLALCSSVPDYKTQTLKKTDMENRLDFSLLDKFARRRVRTDAIGEYVNYFWSFTDESGTRIQLSGNTRREIVVRHTPQNLHFTKY